MRRHALYAVVSLLMAVLLYACGGGGEQKISASQVKPLFDKGGCGACHVIPGIAGAQGNIGPNLCMVGEEVQEGKETLDAVIREIVDPRANITPGYEHQAEAMPTNFGEIFTQEELKLMAQYLAQQTCK